MQIYDPGRTAVGKDHQEKGHSEAVIGAEKMPRLKIAHTRDPADALLT